MRQAAAVWAFVTALAVLCGTAGATIHVSTTGNDSADGLSWATAKRTVQAGLNAAAAGDEVWVAAGTYVERITLKAGVALYGGFTGSETDLSQRNWVTNVTILDGNKGGSVVTAPAGATQSTRIDGFTIQGGTGTLQSDGNREGGGVYCKSSSPTIANNVFFQNDVGLNGRGGGISCYSSSAEITNNAIKGDGGSSGGGIHCVFDSPTITSNTISGYSYGLITQSSSPTISANTFRSNGVAIRGSAGFLTITHNRIVGNSGTGIMIPTSSGMIANNVIMRNGDSAIYCRGGVTIINNKIAGNSTDLYGGGIRCYGSPTIVNNTIVGNYAPSGGGIWCNNGSPIIANTIIAFNSSGLSKGGSGTSVLTTNCVYGNSAYNYYGVPDPAGANGNISGDPGLSDVIYGGIHLQPDSPCVDAGDDGVIQDEWVDQDGQPRKQGTHADIGADESDGTAWPCEPNVIVRVSPTGNDANDGASWSQAKQTVQAGIDAAAAAGGEVWVTEGTYARKITLWSFAHVYGGFAGTETDRSARNPAGHMSILEGRQDGSVVTVHAGGDRLCTVDGFTICNGMAGISCASSFARIAHNRITANVEAGISCTSASPVIENNAIVGNGGGVGCSSSSPMILNNAILGNSRGGISCDSSSLAVINNTLVGNGGDDGGGIFCESSLVRISNTIIAFNTSGICAIGSSTVTVDHTCVYGNTAYNYSGVNDPSGANGNINSDPMLAGPSYGNVHIQPDSPCIDAGDDSAVQPGWLDTDGQGRIAGTHVDIGVDESYGTVWPSRPSVVVRVRPDGNDADDGASWESAKRTLQSAIDVAAAMGGEVWVAAGTYGERIALRNFVHVYGGFAGTEAHLDERNWSSCLTVLDGAQGGSVVTASGLGTLSTIDGFTIRNGCGTVVGDYTYGGGIYCYRASPVIANNTITGNNPSHGGGIACDRSSSPTIRNCTITANRVSDWGGGIYCRESSSPVIANCRIAGNSAHTGGGVYWYWSSLVITNTAIMGNVTIGNGGGVYCTNSLRGSIINTVIAGNSAASGGGMYCDTYTSPTITGCTIAGNSVVYGGGGMYLYSSSPTIADTAITFNSSGIRKNGSGTASFRYSCVYGNTAYNYSGLPDATGTYGNISVDPLFSRLPSAGPDGVWGTTDDDFGDLHLLAGSPCINTGDPAYVPPAGETDMDGHPRRIGSRVDIGADEFWWQGDGNYDGYVNVGDLQLLIQAWATQSGDAGYVAGADANSDGCINIVDLQILVGNWAKS